MTHPHEHAFGVDVGGSGIKGALVDLMTGEFVGQRYVVDTPQPATPDAVAATVARIVDDAGWDGPVGVALPSVIREQVAVTAANIDPAWIGTNCHDLLTRHLGERPLAILNDADAAGLAEVAHGVDEARRGSVIFLTFGTGIGSAFFAHGALFSNTELGHLLIDGTEAERLASSAAKVRDGLGFAAWASRVDTVLAEFERLFNPSAFIVGGGISTDAGQWLPHLSIRTPVLPARLRNRAGVVGAAMAAAHHVTP
ncbi:polyphosphate--glucose phosphotransferase [Corynebacterium timonense]|nr:ROK family protein [Corynebacterium timonense]